MIILIAALSVQRLIRLPTNINCYAGIYNMSFYLSV